MKRQRQILSNILVKKDLVAYGDNRSVTLDFSEFYFAKQRANVDGSFLQRYDRRFAIVSRVCTLFAPRSSLVAQEAHPLQRLQTSPSDRLDFLWSRLDNLIEISFQCLQYIH